MNKDDIMNKKVNYSVSLWFADLTNKDLDYFKNPIYGSIFDIFGGILDVYNFKDLDEGKKKFTELKNKYKYVMNSIDFIVLA